MQKVIEIFSIFLILTGICLFNPASSFAVDVKIIDYHYNTHYDPGETVGGFSVTVKNNTASWYDIFINVVLTNHATGVEQSPYLSNQNAVTVLAGETTTITTNTTGSGYTWNARAGLYTVTIISYHTAVLAANETHRVSGKEPVHVGTTTDSVAAFPKVLDLGALQYGRYMHPVPIEISWDFYLRSTQIRKDHPWYMRIYTDNHKRYKGVDGAIYSGRIPTQEGGSASAMGSPAGLVSSDGKFTIPLKGWCLNFGPDVEEGWDTNLLGPPPVKEDYYWKGPLLDNGKRDNSRVAWEWVPDYIDMSADPSTWRKLIGQDPFDTHYVSDSNPTGDFTLTSPFQLFIAYETSPTAVQGKYSTDLIIEIYSP